MRIPYLTVAMTNSCNFNCRYCSPDGKGGMGEAYATKNCKVDIEDLKQKILIAQELGCEKVRITGGEPLLVRGMMTLLKFLDKQTDMEYAIATNGSLVHNFVDDLEKLKRVDVRISLDTLNAKTFTNMCKVPVTIQQKVMKNIKLLSGKGLLNRVAAVITKENMHELPELIRFCEKLQINLKLFDMYSTPHSRAAWHENYADLKTVNELVETKAKSKRMISYTRYFGIPAYEYELGNGQIIRIKDSKEGTRYHDELCNGCPNMPCQEGLYTILYSCDKKLIPCRLSPKQFKADTPEEFRESFIYLTKVFREAYHENRFWSKRILHEKVGEPADIEAL